MSDKERVKAKYPDAEISTAFATQKDGIRKWMYCAMSYLKVLASRDKKKRVCNVGAWKFSEPEAWASAVRRMKEESR